MLLLRWFCWPLWLLIDIFYVCVAQQFYWRDRGIPYLLPKFRYGNVKFYWKGVKSLPQIIQEIYNTFQERRYCGFFQFNLPVLMLLDPSDIYKITVTDAHLFRDYGCFSSPSADSFWTKSLFAREGDRSRSKLREAAVESFSDLRLETMLEFTKKCARSFTDHFTQPKMQLVVEVEDAFKKVSNDIMAAIIFAYTCDSFENPRNKFYAKALEALDAKAQRYDYFLASIHPSLSKFRGLNLLSSTNYSYFRSMAKKIIKRGNGANRDLSDVLYDLIQIKNKYPEITNEAVAAVTIEFFMTGLDMTSRALTFLAYELALHQKVQNRLRVEIDDIFRNEPTNRISLHVIRNMKYLNMVVLEALRKWPLFTVSDKELTKPYLLKSDDWNEVPIYLDTGTIVAVPIFAIHRSRNYYRDPEFLDPNRFELGYQEMPNFLPFGTGHRELFGHRFVLLQIQTVIMYILRKFRIEIVPNKTEIPLALSRKSLNPLPEKGLWLHLVKRADVE